MQYIISIMKKLLPKTNKEIEEQYLSEAVDLTDLERRQKKLLRGINNVY